MGHGVYHALLLNLWLKDTEKQALFERTMLFEAFDLDFPEERTDQEVDKFVFMLDVATQF